MIIKKIKINNSKIDLNKIIWFKKKPTVFLIKGEYIKMKSKIIKKKSKIKMKSKSKIKSKIKMKRKIIKMKSKIIKKISELIINKIKITNIWTNKIRAKMMNPKKIKIQNLLIGVI